MDREQILEDLREWIQNLRDKHIDAIQLAILEVWIDDRERMYE